MNEEQRKAKRREYSRRYYDKHLRKDHLSQGKEEMIAKEARIFLEKIQKIEEN